ncbi:MAG: hypothetical protein L3K03_02615 [Thermoplasmata archaeon]|nr:hypothetical protein [Thermoplasmata archaeon]
MTIPPVTSPNAVLPSNRVGAESALRRLGYAPVPGTGEVSPAVPSFWVQEPGARKRRLRVYADGWDAFDRDGAISDPPAIVVVPTEQAADQAWEKLYRSPKARLDPDISILVVPTAGRKEPDPHWHAGPVDRQDLLKLATGVLVGLVRRVQNSPGLDFHQMLEVMRTTFHVDVERSLSVEGDEAVLWMMYQIALRYAYAPGDAASNLHLITLKPTGPGARLPWFAA